MAVALTVKNTHRLKHEALCSVPSLFSQCSIDGHLGCFQLLAHISSSVSASDTKRNVANNHRTAIEYGNDCLLFKAPKAQSGTLSFHSHAIIWSQPHGQAPGQRWRIAPLVMGTGRLRSWQEELRPQQSCKMLSMHFEIYSEMISGTESKCICHFSRYYQILLHSSLFFQKISTSTSLFS